MAQIYVHSKTPLRDAPGELFRRRVEYGGGIRYTVAPGCDMNAVTDAVFRALTRIVTQKRLKEGGATADGAQYVDAFSEKLSSYLYITGARQKIEEAIEAVLSERGIIDIDGFATFRMKEHDCDIAAFFDLLFYKRCVRKQYDEFIALLREYVCLGSPREEAVHVVFNGGGFSLYNADKADITYQALKSFRNDWDFSGGNINDFLIASLLHYLPKKIIIHCGEDRLENVRITETVLAVFGERVSCCEGGCCGLCGYGMESGLMEHNNR